jgi:hypothetical protein
MSTMLKCALGSVGDHDLTITDINCFDLLTLYTFSDSYGDAFEEMLVGLKYIFAASTNEMDKVTARSKSQPLYSHKEHKESSDQFTFQVRRAVPGAPSAILHARPLCYQA